MERYVVKVLSTEYLTHNVRRFVVEKPAGYSYIPGQATDVAINRPGYDTELRPFTFTSPVNANHLEFIIKIYTGHGGVTEQLATIVPGDELIIHEVFGVIQYKGPGVFIAGGAGITPFIAILRQLQAAGELAGNTLLFANHTTADIILKDELAALLGEHYINIIKSAPPGVAKMLIDKELLSMCANGKASYYYICGPDQFTADMTGILRELNVPEDHIIFEK